MHIFILILLGFAIGSGMATKAELNEFVNQCSAELREPKYSDSPPPQAYGQIDAILYANDKSKILLLCIMKKLNVIESKTTFRLNKMRNIVKKVFYANSAEAKKAVNLCALLFHPKEPDTEHYIAHCLARIFDSHAF